MNATTARKIWDLLTSAERRSAVVLLGLMVIGMAQTQILCRDSARRYEMGEAGRKLFEDNCTFDSFRARFVRAMIMS